jgi:hypothetical protein
MHDTPSVEHPPPAPAPVARPATPAPPQSPQEARAARWRRIAGTASMATDVGLLASLIAWQWAEQQALATAPWKVPIFLALATLACGAVALIACRRSNRVLLFLFDLAAVLVAAWLFDHLYGRVAATAGHAFWLR